MLVTGGLGFIGSAFIRRMLSRELIDQPLINLDLQTYAANPNSVASVQDLPLYVPIKGCISDIQLLESLKEQYNFSTIVHFAAETHVDNSIENPFSFVKTNIIGTFALLEFVRKYSDIRLHIISTDEVYGSLTDTGIFTEKSPFQPNSPYSASKASADHLARAYHKTYGLNITISHASNNFGPFQHTEKLIPLLLYKLTQKQPLPIYGNGLNVRDWLYVEDHAAAIYEILKNGKPGSVYNIGGSNEWTNIDLVHLLIHQFATLTDQDPHKLEQLITFVEDRPGHDYRYALSNQKINDEIGWSPTISLEEGLEKTIQWYLDEQKQNSLHHSCTL